MILQVKLILNIKICGFLSPLLSEDLPISSSLKSHVLVMDHIQEVRLPPKLGQGK